MSQNTSDIGSFSGTT